MAYKAKVYPIVWLTGLSGSGKTSIAKELSQRLRARGIPVTHIDGDSLRNRFVDLGFDRPSRLRNMRRAARLAREAQDRGELALVSLISPYRRLRESFRTRYAPFLEIYLATSLEVCEKRDPKGLYRKARAGKISQFTGISDPYEAPLAPDLSLDTNTQNVEKSCTEVLNVLLHHNWI